MGRLKHVKCADDNYDLEEDFEFANVGDDAIVSEEDLRFLAEDGTQDTRWADFYEMLRKERALGNMDSPNAAFMAWNLLQARIHNLKYKSSRTNNETINDVNQSAYVIIATKIKDYDEQKDCSFPTYIDKWFQGLARETRNDGMSDYQRKKKGLSLVSSDSIANYRKNNYGDNGTDNVYSQAMDTDEPVSALAPSVDDVMEKKERQLTNAMLRIFIGDAAENRPEDPNELKNLYVKTTMFSKLAGGFTNLPDCMREELCEMALEMDV